MADLGQNKKRIAQLLRMLSSTGGERRNAFAALERAITEVLAAPSPVRRPQAAPDEKNVEAVLDLYRELLSDRPAAQTTLLRPVGTPSE